MIPFNFPPWLGSQLELSSNAIKNRKICRDSEFTKKFSAWLESATSCAKALLTTSCTHALEMTAILADIRPGNEVIIAYELFFGTTFISMYALKVVPLSMTPVLEANGYIFIAVLSHIFLKEKMTKKQLIGMGLILIGIVIYSLKKQDAHHERNNPRRRQRHAALSKHDRGFKVASSDLRQAASLLPAVGVPAGGNTGDPRYLRA